MSENHPVLQRLARLLAVPPEMIVAAAQQAPALSADALLANRRALADRRRELADANAQAASAHAARLRPIHERLKAVEARLNDLRQEAGAANSEMFDVEVDYAQQLAAREREGGVLEAELRHSADPKLAAFVEEAWAELGVRCVSGPQGYQSYQVEHRLTGTRRLFSNRVTLEARIGALRKAIDCAEAMKLEALTSEQVEAQLQALRDALPVVVDALVA